MKTALLFGSSGLIGGHLTKQLIENSSYSKVKLFVRVDPKINNPKIQVIKTDFNNLQNHKDLGIHTEMFTDDLLKLMENGSITNAKKC